MKTFLQTWWHFTHYYYPLATSLGKITNCPFMPGSSTLSHCFWTPFFHANDESRFAQMTAKCYGSKSSSICWWNLRRNVSSHLSIYLVVCWIVFFVKTQHNSFQTLVHTSVTCYSAHSEHDAQWHVQYPNIISLFWIE
jgi:hypothetical protein